MKRELQNKLYEKYPEIFQDRTKPMTETAMCWGIDCDDGWYDIIEKLCDTIMIIRGNSNPIASQVKEKYGVLCFYINGGDDAVYLAIRMAERASSITCEICGKEGELWENITGWMKTLCISDGLALGYIPDGNV